MAALRLEKRKWELLTAERDAHRSRTGDLEAEIARLKVRRRGHLSSGGGWLRIAQLM